MRVISFVLTFIFFSFSSFLFATEPQSITLTDDAGRVVELPEPAKRVVALSPHIVENIFSVGGGEKIVAAVEYSDYPDQAKLISRVGRFDSISLEKIVALQPDLVIVWGSGGGLKFVDRLTSLGLSVYVDDPKNLKGIANSLKQFSILLGKETVGMPVANEFEQLLQQYRQQSLSTKPVSVFYQLWHNPIQTVNGDHVINDVITLCGGENIFAKTQSIAPKVNVESVLQKNPQVILASGVDDQKPAWLNEWNKWPSLSAVKSSHLYHIPPDFLQRHTLRIATGIELVCNYLTDAKE